MPTILRVALLVLAALTAPLVPVAGTSSQSTNAPTPALHFEVASVRLNSSAERPRRRVNAVPATGTLTLTNMSVLEVILSAYGIQQFELVGNGSPVLQQRIDIVAKATPPTTVADIQQMLQPLVEERFKLAVHREMREKDALLLVRIDAQRLGPKIKVSTRDCRGLGTTDAFAFNVEASTNGQDRCGVKPAGGPGRIVANGIDMRGLASELAPSQGRPVLDLTRLEGRFDVDLSYTPEPFSAAALARRGATAPPGVNPNGPPLATALQDQLGLKLEARRAPVSVVVIDRIEPLIPD